MVFTAPPVLQHCGKADKSLRAQCEKSIILLNVSARPCSLLLRAGSAWQWTRSGAPRIRDRSSTKHLPCAVKHAPANISILQQRRDLCTKRVSVADSRRGGRFTATLDGFWLWGWAVSVLTEVQKFRVLAALSWLCPSCEGLGAIPVGSTGTIGHLLTLTHHQCHALTSPTNKDFVSHQAVDLN